MEGQESGVIGMKIKVCNVDIKHGEAKGKWTVYWNTEDKLLYLDAMETPFFCETVEDALEMAQVAFDCPGYDFEWAEMEV